MQAVPWENIETIFNHTILLPPEQRHEYVLSACREDEALFQEVISLIEEAENSENFLSQPVFELGTRLLASDPIGLLKEPDFASYQLLSVLGRGGTGVVFLAKDKNLERLVALKVLPFSLSDNDERILRFQREAKAASAISHPNFAHIYEFGKAKDRFYIAMEYVSGKTLRQLLKSKEIDVIKAFEISIQVAKALLTAHRADIIHRDIKPENIIITEDWLVKILDFGLAKMFDSNRLSKNLNSNISLQTSPGLVIGTVSYMSPEQVRGKPLDARTDLWSLGVLLYEMLAGQRPFVGETPSDVQALILLTEPNFPLHLEKIFEIKQILTKLLAKKVEDRYQNAANLLNDLKVVHKYLLGQSPQEEIHLSFASSDSPENNRQHKSVIKVYIQKILNIMK
ncbi:MAG: serine/threonine protein kinase [Pyrinomonadaceae bacterium]